MKLFLMLILTCQLMITSLFAQVGTETQENYDCELNGEYFTMEAFSRTEPAPGPGPAPLPPFPGPARTGSDNGGDRGTGSLSPSAGGRSSIPSYDFLRIIDSDGNITESTYFKVSFMAFEANQKIFALADFTNAKLYKCTKRPVLEPVFVVKTGYLVRMAGTSGASTGFGLLVQGGDGIAIELDGVNNDIVKQLSNHLKRTTRMPITVEGKFVRRGSSKAATRTIFIVYSIRNFN